MTRDWTMTAASARAIVTAAASLGVLAAPARSQETDAERARRLMRIRPEALAQAFLANEHTVNLIEQFAKQGATLHLTGPEGTIEVTPGNADSMLAEHEHRRDVYAATIGARGYAQVSGDYEAIAAEACRPGGASADTSFVTVYQDEFKIEVTPQGAAREDLVEGVIVDDALVLGEGDPASDLVGRARRDRIELRASQNSKCRITFRPFDASARPRVELENPAMLVGSWEGQWDGEWAVRFTITAADNGYLVRYEWEESPGGPFETLTFLAYPISKNSIRVSSGDIEITTENDDVYGATAIGKFRPQRTARLKRIP